MGIASLVLGIISILLSFSGFAWFAICLGTVGIVLGALARKRYGGGMATAGFVLSIIGTSLTLLWLAGWLALASFLKRTIGYFI